MSRVAVVTGASSGMGAAIAQALATAGHVVIGGSRRASAAAPVQAYPLDVAAPDSVQAFCQRVKAQHGAPQILVNAAGIYLERPVSADDPSHWHDQIATNLTGPYLMTRALMPDMIAGGFGRIVNIASTAARTPYAGFSGYCASKAGLVALSRVTAQEGAAHNVSCVSISPTWVETPMMDASLNAAEKAALAKGSPQGRLVQPQEVAALVAFCCGEACPALTFEDIQVNAGALW